MIPGQVANARHEGRKMAPELRPGAPDGDDELFIHLDLDGLTALLRAVEAALATGRGHLTSESAGGKGIAVTTGPSAGLGRRIRNKPRPGRLRRPFGRLEAAIRAGFLGK
jgi:hypothetical protein